jgi:hypothetical protein
MEVVDGKSEENNGFRGVWIMRDEGMARKTDSLGKRVSVGGSGTSQQANRYIFLY